MGFVGLCGFACFGGFYGVGLIGNIDLEWVSWGWVFWRVWQFGFGVGGFGLCCGFVVGLGFERVVLGFSVLGGVGVIWVLWGGWIYVFGLVGWVFCL